MGLSMSHCLVSLRRVVRGFCRCFRAVAHSLSELEEYLEQPPAPNQTDVLSYWREQTQWTSLQRMARHYLCVPATSTDVERLFSRAMLTHGDLRTCLSEENLSNILFAAYNYDPSLH